MTTSLAPHPLLIPPALAKEIGLHEAVILQQIHYWLEKSNHLINGCLWIYNTYLSSMARAVSLLKPECNPSGDRSIRGIEFAKN